MYERVPTSNIVVLAICIVNPLYQFCIKKLRHIHVYDFIHVDNIKISYFVIQEPAHDGRVCGEEQHELWRDGEDEDCRPKTTHHGSAHGNLLRGKG